MSLSILFPFWVAAEQKDGLLLLGRDSSPPRFFVSDVAIFVLKWDVKLQLTNLSLYCIMTGHGGGHSIKLIWSLCCVMTGIAADVPINKSSHYFINKSGHIVLCCDRVLWLTFRLRHSSCLNCLVTVNTLASTVPWTSCPRLTRSFTRV